MNKQLEDPGTGLEPEAANQVANPKAQERAKVRQRVAAHRARTIPSKLREAQQAALAQLPSAERERLINQAEDCDLLTWAANRCSLAIAAGQSPQDPIGLYTDVRDFVAEHGLTSDWLPGIDVLAALDADDQDTFSDREFVRYGLRLKPFSAFYHEFVRHLAIWLTDHADHPCDPAIKTEIETLAKQDSNVPEIRDDYPSGYYSQKDLDRKQAEKHDFEKELARFEKERIDNWNREIKERALQGPIGIFESQIGSGL